MSKEVFKFNIVINKSKSNYIVSEDYLKQLGQPAVFKIVESASQYIRWSATFFKQKTSRSTNIKYNRFKIREHGSRLSES